MKIKIAIVAGTFNDFITRNLLAGCLAELKRKGVAEKNVQIVWVPGACEIPVTALKLARKTTTDAVICLGAVIRGDTYHFELVCNSAVYGIQQAALLSGKPVIFGVLSTDTVQQAQKRAELKGDNKGVDAARAALEMVKVLKSI